MLNRHEGSEWLKTLWNALPEQQFINTKKHHLTHYNIEFLSFIFIHLICYFGVIFMPLLELKQLSVEQAGKVLWQDLLFVRCGERLGISAPWHRKTTLGRFSQWQMPTQGSILVNGKPLSNKGYCPIQLVPQHLINVLTLSNNGR